MARSGLWSTLFVGLALIGAAWVMATPIGGTPDERAHIFHAAGVAGGEFFAKPEAAVYGTGAFHHVPQGLVRQCGADGVSDLCDDLPDPSATVRVGTYVGRYNPIYYAVVGWPLRLWPNVVGLLTARMISVLLVAGVLTGAAYCGARLRRHRALVPALVVAGTPMLFHLMGAVNPNALEIAAGTLFFCAAVALATPAPEPSTAAVRWAGIAGILLMTLRGFGPIWFGIGLVVLLLGVPRSHLRVLAKSSTVRRWSAAVLVAGVLGVSWTVLMKATAGAAVATDHVSMPDALKEMFLVYWGALLIQMVGNLGYLSTSLPNVVIFTWAGVVGFLMVGVVALGRRAAKVRLVVLVLACLAIPAIATVKAVNTLGFFWQGRYSLPLAVGVPILAAEELAMVGILTAPAVRRLTRALVILLLPTQLLALWLMLIRWQNKMIQIGVDFPLNPLSSTGWRPPLGPLVPLLAMVAGLAIAGLVYLRLAAQRTPGAQWSDPAASTELDTGASDDGRRTGSGAVALP